MKDLISKISTLIPSDFEGALITNPSDLVYVTDLYGVEGFVLATRRNATLYTDGRYIEAARKSISWMDVALLKRGVSPITAAKEHCVKTVICQESISAKRLENLNAQEEVKFLLCDLFDSGLMNLRKVKSQREISRMKTAQEITDQAFSHALNIISVGISERDLAAEIDYFMRKNGADGSAFDTIAISGQNTSLPHGIPTARTIKKGDFVTMDFGAMIKGCKSDMTRTVAVGYATDRMKEVYNTVLKAQISCLNEIKAGVSCKDADGIARRIIENAGYGQYFTHSTGHGVGFEIHELPNLSPSSTDILRVSNVVTVEPGIYIPDNFGVRIEDYGMITEEGFDNFTSSPKELIVL